MRSPWRQNCRHTCYRICVLRLQRRISAKISLGFLMGVAASNFSLKKYEVDIVLKHHTMVVYRWHREANSAELLITRIANLKYG